MKHVPACLVALALLLSSCTAPPARAADHEEVLPQPPAAGAIARTYAETPARRDERMKWWREARYGMFIHWGIYAQPAGVWKGQVVDPKHGSEWIQCDALLSRAEYEPLARTFNPVRFDAAQWVQLARQAGMKYMVITSKHHDGFCMYDTKLSDYSIVRRSPYGKDPMGALADECKKAGIRFGFYYSQLDWHHPAQQNNPKHEGRKAYRFNAVTDKPAYVAFLKGQLRELIENYDPAVLFFDGEWTDWWTAEDGKDLELYVRSLKKDIILNNRVGKRKPGDGDYGTPEQQIPATGLNYDWETCMTLNGTWGYKSYDKAWKSRRDVVRKLVDIASKGGNFLLNVGPTAEGIIPEASAERLREVGKWLSVNGEAVYATQASPFDRPAWGRYTRKPGVIYAHVFDWPADGRLEVPVAAERIARAAVLGRGEVKVEPVGKSGVILVGNRPSDPDVSVVAIELRP